MTAGTIILQGFACVVHDGEANKLLDGKPTGEKIPLKILEFKDAHSQLKVHICFQQDEFETFAKQMKNVTSRLIRPDFAPGGRFSPFTRNGGIRG